VVVGKEAVMRRSIAVVLFVLLSLSLSGAAAEQRYSIPLLDSPSKGPENSPVTIIEFLDFQ
jgi:hypothetical protein